MTSPSTRRTFLQAGATALGALTLPPHLVAGASPLESSSPLGAALLGRSGARRRSMDGTDVRIDVLPQEAVGPVTSAHYGHFVEHLGAVIYDGLWVGEGSKIPNIGGLRKSLVDDLRALTPGVVRWPGGCFADSYDWTDGIGPRAKRPTRTNFWTGNLPPSVAGAARYEDNQFGTPEFLQFCRLIGADPYLAVNARGRSAQDFSRWVEYCNAPRGSTTLARQREADGAPEPYNVKYWGVGNEPWGCGGQLSPEEYALEYRRFTAWVPEYPTSSATTGRNMMTPLLIAGGPNEADFAWTQRFMESMTSVRADMPYGFSVHDYFHRSDALNFTSTGWYSLLAQPRHFVDMLERHGQLVRVGTRKPMTLVVDEWGPWYHGQTGSTDPAHLFEQVPTLRDALVTAMMFDAFHSHADIVGMTTVAQTVNCIHSLFLTQGEHYVRTPVYHAFALYQPHIGGTAVRTIAAADRITFTSDAPNEGASWIAGVSASATRHDASGAQGKHIVLTVTNPHLDRALSTTVVVRGATVRSGDVTQLTHTDPHAHNTFDAPEVVRLGATAPLALPTSSASDTFTLTLPPASVTRVVCMLGV